MYTKDSPTNALDCHPLRCLWSIHNILSIYKAGHITATMVTWTSLAILLFLENQITPPPPSLAVLLFLENQITPPPPNIPGQDGRHFAGNIFKRIFVNKNARISIQFSLKCVAKCSIDNKSALIQAEKAQVIILTNANPVHQRIYAALGGDKLIVPFSCIRCYQISPIEPVTENTLPESGGHTALFRLS